MCCNSKIKVISPKAKNRLFWYFLSLVILNATLEFEHKRNEFCAVGSFNFFGEKRRVASITDGLSNTVMVSEVIAGCNWPELSRADWRGLWWLDQGAAYSHFLTPNSKAKDRIGGVGPQESNKLGLPGYEVGGGGWGGFMTGARSYHPSCVIATYADGSVRIINDDISSTVWTALGSMNGGEVVAAP